MKLKNGRISLLFNEDGLHIELHDSTASIQFVDVHLNQEQTCQALSRLGYTHCDVTVHSLSKVGKKMVMDSIIFPLPEGVNWKDQKSIAIQEVKRLCSTEFEGWEPDIHFGSQGSFFQKDGKPWAKTIIRKWVDVEESDEEGQDY